MRSLPSWPVGIVGVRASLSPPVILRAGVPPAADGAACGAITGLAVLLLAVPQVLVGAWLVKSLLPRRPVS